MRCPWCPFKSKSYQDRNRHEIFQHFEKWQEIQEEKLKLFPLKRGQFKKDFSPERTTLLSSIVTSKGICGGLD